MVLNKYVILTLICAVALIGTVSAGNMVTTDTTSVPGYIVKKYTYSQYGGDNSTWTVPSGITEAWILIIAGGAGGGGYFGGGSGGGGVINTTITGLTKGTVYNISVGAGGGSSLNGANSTFGDTLYMSLGGGRGSIGGGGTGRYALQGGSGGGGARSSTSQYLVAGEGYSTQGSRGGYGNAAVYAGAGGGGATALGANVTSANGGNGGAGFTSNITGTSTCYAGGGGGATADANTAGTATCGGGAGGRHNSGTGAVIAAAQPGTNSTGGGAGGGGTTAGADTAPIGGSGVIIIQYKNPVDLGSASFTKNGTTDNRANVRTIQFTDTSDGVISGYNWTFNNIDTLYGNNTETLFSSSANPAYTFTRGNWSIRLNVTNATHYNLSPVQWVNVTPWILQETIGSDVILTFTDPVGSTEWYVPTNVYSIQYVVVAGGGTGNAGGGGAGGMLNGTGYSTTPETKIEVTVGAAGVNSSLNTLLNATRGGAGGINYNGVGQAGGSGGGGSQPTSGFTASHLYTGGGTGTAGQGNNGGNGHAYQSTSLAGGGGGAGAAGVDAFTSQAGGAGRATTINGTSMTYAAGGSGAGGAASAANTGNGGNAGNAGASGIVVIRYSSAALAANFTANVSESNFGLGLRTVQFTDDSAGTPASWNWSFRHMTDSNNLAANQTEVWFSTTQHPVYTFTAGNWSIRLNATNSVATNTTTSLTRWINITPYYYNKIGNVSYLTFTDTATNHSWIPPPYGIQSVDYWVIAGGGTGGAGSQHFSDTGGAGGAGGYLNGSMAVTNTTIYTVRVGTAAHNSTFDGINASAGGSGGSSGEWGTSPGTGGSGGGAGSWAGDSQYHTLGGAAGIVGQGHDGGAGGNSFSNKGGGGGGGAGGAGGLWSDGGNGGAGITVYFNGTTMCLAGGGASAIGTGTNEFYTTTGTATCGGGTIDVEGTANTGGGGGAGPGVYANGKAGGSGIVLISYELKAAPKAQFTMNQTEGFFILPVQFNDTSLNTPTLWNWSFGDGTYSKLQNVTHEYSSGGNYTVTLNVQSANGLDSAIGYVEVWNTTTSGISANMTSGFLPEFAVAFSGTADNATVYNWSFGEGNFSDQLNPTHVYYAAGTYNVNFSASNSHYTNWTNLSSYITVTDIPPVADFTAVPTSGLFPLTVTFNDTSSGGAVTTWNWSFGDGYYSADKNTTHIYNTGGVYNTKLTVANSGGESNKTGSITVYNSTVSGFSANQTEGLFNLPVLFTTDIVNDNATAWDWSFNGGLTWTNDTTQNYTKIFSSGGTYTIIRVAKNTNGGYNTSTLTDYITVWNSTTSAFVGVPTSGTTPVSVQFTGTANNATTFLWDFGDLNTTNNNLQSPEHTYSTPGTYTVSFTASNAHATNTTTHTNYIVINQIPAPTANFTASSWTGSPGDSITFNDTSTGTPASWNWSFGDGYVSSEQHPIHQYNIGGNFHVNLTATNAGGSSSIIKDVLIANVPGAAITSNVTLGVFPFVVQFYDNSTNVPTSWNWSFGDGGYSEEQHPKHIFNTLGNKTVTLTATNSFGSNATTVEIYVITPVIAQFGANQTMGLSPLGVQFNDASTGNPTAYNWSFGDGTYSDSQNPAHEYTNIGSYDVILTVAKQYASDSETKLGYIVVQAANAPVANFIAAPTAGSAPLVVGYTDMSTGAVINYNWSFGDGTYSTVQYPSHTYATFGVYTVSLYVDNTHGNNTMTRPNYITVGNATGTPTPTVGPTPAPELQVSEHEVIIDAEVGEEYIQWSFEAKNKTQGLPPMNIYIDDAQSPRITNYTLSTLLLSDLVPGERHNIKIYNATAALSGNATFLGKATAVTSTPGYTILFMIVISLIILIALIFMRNNLVYIVLLSILNIGIDIFGMSMSSGSQSYIFIAIAGLTVIIGAVVGIPKLREEVWF